MRLLHGAARTRAVFDDPNLLAHAGLAPLMTLAGRAGLAESLAGVRPAGACGANAATKAVCLVAGMAAGADSIDDMDLLRDGAMETVFGGIRAPSTLGSHLRSYKWGNVRQLDAAHRQLLPHWPYWGYLAYLGWSLVFALIVLVLAVQVFGRTEANFAEEL